MRRRLGEEWLKARGVRRRPYLPQLVAGLRIPLDVVLDYCGVLPVVRSGGDSWEMDESGEDALIVGVPENGKLVDLLAVLGTQPSDWLLARSIPALLGQDNADQPMATGEPLRIRRSPVSWLRDRARGVCILDWSRARGALPSHRPLAGEDMDHAAELFRRLSVTPSVVVAANG